MKNPKDGGNFMTITNKDIYDRIELLGRNNALDHEQIIKHQIETNGKVKLNRWIATTALALALILIGYALQKLI